MKTMENVILKIVNYFIYKKTHFPTKFRLMGIIDTTYVIIKIVKSQIVDIYILFGLKIIVYNLFRQNVKIIVIIM